MPAKSEKQQQFFGIVRAMQKGEQEPSGKAGEVAEDMDPKDVKKFAQTKHEGLPAEVDKEAAIAGYVSGYEQKVAKAGVFKTLKMLAPGAIKKWLVQGPAGFNAASAARTGGKGGQAVVRPGLSKSLAHTADWAPSAAVGSGTYHASKDSGMGDMQSGVNALLAAAAFNPRLHRGLWARASDPENIKKGVDPAMRMLSMETGVLGAKGAAGLGLQGILDASETMSDINSISGDIKKKAPAITGNLESTTASTAKAAEESVDAMKAVQGLQESIDRGVNVASSAVGTAEKPGTLTKPLQAATQSLEHAVGTPDKPGTLTKPLSEAADIGRHAFVGSGAPGDTGTITGALSSVGTGIGGIGDTVEKTVSGATKNIDALSQNLNTALTTLREAADDPVVKRNALVGLIAVLGTYGAVKLAPMVAERPRSVRYYYN